MKKILFVFTAVLLGYAVQAQCSGKNTDAEAKKVLDGVSTKYKSFNSVSAKFTIKGENASGKTLNSKSGTFTAKGNKYRASITGQEIFCDGATVWTYDKGANEVTITKFDGTNSTITPQKIFTNFYDKDFLYKLNGEKAESCKTLQEIEMTPCNKTRPYSKVYIYVDKTGSTIAKAKILEKSSNNRTVMSVNSFTPNAAASDASFKFDAAKYPGVEVIDLR
jgi:outer membrane lipoprotein-sorting protein